MPFWSSVVVIDRFSVEINMRYHLPGSFIAHILYTGTLTHRVRRWTAKNVLFCLSRAPDWIQTVSIVPSVFRQSVESRGRNIHPRKSDLVARIRFLFRNRHRKVVCTKWRLQGNFSRARRNRFFIYYFFF